MEANRRERLQDLIAQFREGHLAAEEANALNDLLAADPRARRLWVGHILLQVLLEKELGAATVEDLVCVSDCDPALLSLCSVVDPDAPHDSLSGVGAETYVAEEYSAEDYGHGLRSPTARREASGKHSPGAPRSSLGFLVKLGRRSWRFVSQPMSFFTAVAALFVAAIVLTGIAQHNRGQQEAGNTPADLAISGSPSFPADKASASSASRVAASAIPAARLGRATDCRWAEESTAPRQGDSLLAHRRLELRAGTAEIVFNGGARGVLKGPATLVVLSADSAFLGAGDITLDNPVAKDFELFSPDRKYLLSAAEFGLYVVSVDLQEFHVFRGRVAVADTSEHSAGQVAAAQRPGEAAHAPAKEPPGIVLAADESYRSGGGDKLVERFAPDQKRFVPSSPQAEPLLSADFLRWRQASLKLRNDPGLIAYYDFQINAHAPNVLFNRSAAGDKLNGQIDGAGLLQGRWPPKGGLQCHAPNHCVHLNIPGRYAVVTAAAWVNVFSLHQMISSLLDAEMQHATAGQCYWRILGDGRMAIGSRASAAPAAVSLRDPLASIKPVIERADRGAWCLLVAIYDSRANAVTYYKNGLAYGSVQPSTPLAPVVFGHVELGNGGDFKPLLRRDVQYFHGFIDEFALFSRALSLDEIQEMYRVGKCDEKRW